MNTTPPKKEYRKRRLFPRALDEVVKDATKPLMSQQGKLYGALLRDWATIVGHERASVTRPERLQFASTEASGATLHIAARPAAAPELAYATEQMLEQCARYFGYRAINRIVIHASHQGFTDKTAHEPKPTEVAVSSPIRTAMPDSIPSDMRAVLERLAARITSASDKKN